MENLTKEQKYTIAKFYKLYMERSNAGQPEEEANHFKDSVTAQDDYFVIENMKISFITVKS